MTKPTLGISSCLLGNRVRYDGGHKRADWLVKELGKQVAWHVVCPEMEMGLGVPREAVRLVKAGTKVKMVGNQSQTDHTKVAEKTVKRLADELPVLHGFVLKKNSPSCGMERVKLEQKSGADTRDGVGLFAAELIKRYPDLPLIEEGRLSDVEQREHFVTRVFALFRFENLKQTIPELQLFHQRYKYLLMAHQPKAVPKLGKIAANSDRRTVPVAFAEYRALFLPALAEPTTPGRRYNVLQHLFGYLKDRATEKEHRELWEELEGYRSGEVSFQTVVSLLRHASRRLRVEYLEKNLFWDPHPKSLGLRKYLG